MAILIGRRRFVSFVGGAAAWPIAAQAQQPAMPVIGFLHNAIPEARREEIAAFFQGLAEIGYVEGRNVAVEYRWAEGQNDRLPALAAELVQRQVAVIATPGSTPSALAAKAATRSIPIVFWVAADPVEMGLVASLSRPGGNLTGVGILGVEVAGKSLEFLHDLIPAITYIGLLVNPTNPATESYVTEVQKAAHLLGLGLLVQHATGNSDIGPAFTALVQQQVGAVMCMADPIFVTQADQLVELAAHRGLPMISPFREFAAAGGLMSYGSNISDAYRQVGIYVGRILRGERPAQLPVMQSTKVELIINLKTAKALGLTIPPNLLAIADEVIE